MRRVATRLQWAGLAVTLASVASAQGVPPRRLLPVDVARVQPRTLRYEMVVVTRDSSVVIGQRDVTLASAAYGASVAWLLTETRTGLVPAIDSLFLAPDLRPLAWSSVLGASRAALEFRGDSAFGDVSGPSGGHAMAIASSRELIVSGGMIEMLPALLPLSIGWTDSVSVLAADLAGVRVVPAELSVIDEQSLVADATVSGGCSCWVVALRSGGRQVVMWVDKASGAVVKAQQPLAPHTGVVLEYRAR